DPKDPEKIHFLKQLNGKGASEYNGDIREAHDNISIKQDGAVDNSKENVLDKSNLNMKTADVSSVLSMLSDKNGWAANIEYNSYFLTQEAVEMYLEKMESYGGIIASNFSGDPHGTAIKEVKLFIEEKLGSISDEIRNEPLRKRDAFSPSQLKKFL